MTDQKLKSILVVDDTPENLDVVTGVLMPTYKVIAAINGKMALKLAESKKPDLILLDIMMPEIDGYEVCEKLKANPNTAHITKPISPPTLIRRVQTHLSLVRIDELDDLARSAIRMLGEAGHFNDTDTGQHIWRMAAYSRALAEAAGWSVEQTEMLELAAPMHDTGKIGIPDGVLKAPRKLEPDEWKIMMTHSQIGHDILKVSSNAVFKLAADIALGHHEKWDGSGYPNGLKGEETPQAARIAAIADVFDALTMKRPYKEPWTTQAAMEEIKKSAGSHLDPKLVDLFLSIEDQIIQIKAEWDS